MKTIKYIIFGSLIISLVISSFTLSIPQQPLTFSETYTTGEVLSLLKPSDEFFQMIDASELPPESSKMGNFNPSDAKKIGAYIQDASFRAKLPGDLRFAWGALAGDQGRGLFVLKEPGAAYQGPVQADIRKVEIRESEAGQGFGLYLFFGEKGAEKWAAMTRNNEGRNIAILVNGVVYAAPRVMQEISNGECLISGDYTESEINQLRAVLE